MLGEVWIKALQHHISTFFAEKHHTLPPDESYLRCRDNAACPAPDLQQPSLEIRIFLQDREVEENGLLISRRDKRNQTGFGSCLEEDWQSVVVPNYAYVYDSDCPICIQVIRRVVTGITYRRVVGVGYRGKVDEADYSIMVYVGITR